MSVIGRGACLHLPLRASFQQANGVELLRDGFMGEAGVAAWTGTGGAYAKVPYARVGAPATATQAMRLTGVQYVYFRQTPVVVGRTYRARCWARGDGATGYPLLTDFGALYFTVTATGTWTWCDKTFVSASTSVGFYQGGAPDGWCEVAEFSLQEVMMCTLDIGDYTSQYSYLLSDRGGATECAGLRKLDVIDRHTGARTTLADFSASPGAGAVYTLPSGWTYSCATAGRTVQTSAATLVTGIAANAAPAKSVDGVSFKVDVECARTNQPTNSGAWDPGSAGWVAGTMTNVGTYLGPDGGAATAREFSSAVSGRYSSYHSGASAAGSAYSCWTSYISGNATVRFEIGGGGGNVFVPVSAGWRRSDLYCVPASSSPYLIQAIVGNVDIAAYGLQEEVGKYPSSYIPTAGAAITRATATLAAPHDQVAFDSGRIPELIWVPDFAYNETLLDAVILDDSRGRLYYCQADQKFTFTMYGRGTIKSLACTFSREQAVTLRADVDDGTQLATLIVSGCTTGDGTFQTYFNAEKAVQCGDGYTAASFPTQLVPRGMLTAATRYLRRNEPWGNSGACTIVFFMTRDSDAVQYVIDFRGLGAPATGVALYNGGLVVSGGTGYVNGVAGAAWPRYLPSSLAIVGMPITSGGVSGAYYDISYPATGYVGRVYSVMIFPYTLTPTELADLHARAQWECNT